MILDTHVWLRYLLGERLGTSALRRIERARAASRLQVAAVTLWEVALLVSERKVRIDGASGEWLTSALARSSTTVAPLDPGVAQASARLIALLRDPADCQIAGTAQHLGVPLVTRDARILDNARTLGLEALEA